MKTLTFTYTKKDGSVSSRTMLALVTPNKGEHFAGIDVSELDATEAADFVAECKEAHSKYLAELQAIQESYDLKHNYRQFIAANMTAITEI